MSTARRTIQSYRDLRVWQLGMELAVQAYEATRAWPKDEKFGLTSQTRRSISAVPANIAEGFGRETGGAFVQFLRIAQGSLKEFETHVLLAGRIGLLADPEVSTLLLRAEDIGKMLGALIRKVSLKRAEVSDAPALLRPTTHDRRPTLDDEAAP